MTLIEPVTPPAGESPTKADAALIREKYEEGVRDIRNQMLSYQENCSFIEGEQWVYRHKRTNQIIELPRNPRRVRATIPRLGPESRRLFSKLLKRPLVFEVMPNAPDDASVRGAKMAEGVLASLARKQKWEKTREQLAWATWKGGTAGLCLDWDTSKGTYLGETAGGRGYGIGDVCVTALAVTEMVTEPGTRDIETSCWWIKAQALPPSEVKKMYGMKKTPPSDANGATSPQQMRLLRSGGGDVPKNLTLVLTYYERPNADNKSGRVAVIVGDEIVDGPHPWPFPFKDRLNIVCAKETEVEGRWTGRTVVSDAVPVQTALNHSWTSILEHLKQAGNARIQGNTAEKHNAEVFTDEAGEFVWHDVEPFEWMSPPPMPDWWQRTPTELAAAMDDIIGVHDVSRGSAPANIESGLGLSILAEQDDTPTGRFSMTQADAWSALATMVLETYEQNVTEPREARIDTFGEFVAESFTWTGADFAGQTIARVPYDAVAPINEAARFARGISLMDHQVITNPRALSAYIDMPGHSSLIETLDPNVAKARRENYLMATGETCVPADFDNHAIHIEEHNNFRLSARYERLDDQTRAKFDLHVQAHSTLSAEEAAEQMLKMQYAPGLAGAAQANQPPGSMTPFSASGGSPEPQVQPQSAVLGAQTGGNPEESAGGPPPDMMSGESPV